MIRRNLRDAAQLINKPVLRNALTYAYLAFLATWTLVVNYRSRQEIASHPDNLVEVLYLLSAVIVLSSVDVRIERGRLTLSGIAIGAAALLLNPLDATIVGLALAIPMVHRGRWPIGGNAIMAATYVCLAALVAEHLRINGTLTVGSRIFVLMVMHVTTWVLVGGGLSLRTGESVQSIVRHNFSAPFFHESSGGANRGVSKWTSANEPVSASLALSLRVPAESPSPIR